MSAAVDRLLAVARWEVGYHEKASNSDLYDKTANSGSANYTRYARDLDSLGDVYNGKKNGYDWCDVFVDWCFIVTFGETLGMMLLCQPYKGLGAGTKYSMQYYQKKNQFRVKDPQPGDQIFFGDVKSTWHTGLVERVQNGKVYTIEGNAGKGSLQVVRCVYPLNYGTIKGYGRPDWSLVDNTPLVGRVGYVNYESKSGLYCRTCPRTGDVLLTYPYGKALKIIQEMDTWGLVEGQGWVNTAYVAEKKPNVEKGNNDMLTYEQFEEYMERYRKELQAKPGSDWSGEDRAWAVETGLFQGGTDGDGYMWQDFLTREQAAALFRRERAGEK